VANPRQDTSVQPAPPQLLTQVQPAVPGVVLKGTSAVLPPGRPVVARDPSPMSGSARQDEASDLRPGQRPTDGSSPAVVPASTQQKKPSAETEPEDVRQ